MFQDTTYRDQKASPLLPQPVVAVIMVIDIPENDYSEYLLARSVMSQDPLEFHRLPLSIRGNKRLVLRLLQEYDISLGLLSPMLRCDPEVCYYFVFRNPRNRTFVLSRMEAMERIRMESMLDD